MRKKRDKGESDEKREGRNGEGEMELGVRNGTRREEGKERGGNSRKE